MNKIIQWILNIVAGIFFFVLFLFLFFPYESIIRAQLSQMQGPYRIQVGDIDPHIIFKSEFRDFEVSKVSKNGSPELWVQFPKIKIGVRYLSLISGNIKGSFVVPGKNGKELKGGFSLKKNKGGDPKKGPYLLETAEIHLKNFDLSKIAYLENFINPPLKGFVSGSGFVVLDSNNKLTKHQGMANLKFKNLILPPSEGKFGKIPQIVLAQDKQEGVLKFRVDNGQINLETLSFPGGDIVLDLKGNIILSKNVDRYRLQLSGSYKFSDEFSKFVPSLPQLEEQKGEDGSYPLTLQGRFTSPQISIGDLNVNEELAKFGIKI